MKYLFICLLVLVLGAGFVGGKEEAKTGWHCQDCEKPMAKSAVSCPNCGSTLEPDSDLPFWRLYQEEERAKEKMQEEQSKEREGS